MSAGLGNLVRVTSTTTGTGTLTLGSAVTGFITPSGAGIADGQEVTYGIEADYTTVGDDSVPTSREVGRGVYSGGTLTRATIYNSTNSNLALNLAGDEQVIICPVANSWPEMMKPDAGTRDYYVRTDGSDSNSGLVNSAGGAFLTLQKAFDIVEQLCGFNFPTVRINLGSGTFTGGYLDFPIAPTFGIIINGNGSANTTITHSTTSTLTVFGNLGGNVGYVQVQNCKLTNTASSSRYNIHNNSNGFIFIGADVEFGAAASTGGHMLAAAAGAGISVSNNYTVSGGGAAHWIANCPGATILCNSRTITITGTPAFSTAWAYALNGGQIQAISDTFTGSATGPRYSSTNMSSILVNGAGTTYLPGNAAGTGTNPSVSPWGLYA